MKSLKRAAKAKVWTAKMRADFRARMLAAKKAKPPRKVKAKAKPYAGVKKPGRKQRKYPRDRVFALSAFNRPGFVILAINAGEHRAGYYAGKTFDTDRKRATIFESQEHALRVARNHVEKFPRGWRLAVAPADFSPEEEFPHLSLRKTASKKNPAPRAAQSDRVNQAARLFEDFTGHEAKNTRKVLWTVPDVAVQFGELEGVIYNTVRDGKDERYLHEFKKNSRPLLGVSHDGKQLVVVGGHYQFTDAGIEDR